jgi:hypothetical protein
MIPCNKESVMTKISGIYYLAVLLSFLVSCAPGLRTQAVRDSEITGSYTGIFHGCNFLNDLETIVFLDKEGDQYTLEPYSPDFNYKVHKGFSASEAVSEAKKFVNCNSSFSHSQTTGIISPDGRILGYEIRPIYSPFRYGVSDVLYTNYRISGDKVIITIRIIPSVERILHGDIENGRGILQ